jgi:hypothetical protein
MQLLDTSIEPTEAPARVLDSVLRAHGFDAGDFEIAEHETDFTDLLGQGSRIIAVRRRSTGEERLYATGPDTAWLGAFMMDLGCGHFGRMPRGR